MAEVVTRDGEDGMKDPEGRMIFHVTFLSGPK